jgi:hypothetical protein
MRLEKWWGVDWIHLATDWDQWMAFVNMVINLWVSQKDGNLLSGRTTGGFSRT